MGSNQQQKITLIVFTRSLCYTDGIGTNYSIDKDGALNERKKGKKKDFAYSCLVSNN